MSRIGTQQIIVNKRGQVALAFVHTVDSGRIVYRNKIDTIIGIKHPGIVLGIDSTRTIWILHNHYSIGCPQIVTLEEFAQGQDVFFDDRAVQYSREEIINRAIEAWQVGKQYSWLRNNCQQFVNDITQGKHYSETIDRVSENLMLFGGGTFLLGALFGNKAMMKVGASVGGAGIIGKGISRL